MMRAATALLVLALAQPAGLSVDARGEVVTWAGAPGGCVYLVEPGGARTRLGCVRAGGRWEDEDGRLWPGDVIEVRMPTPRGPLTGRAVVEEEG